MKPRGRPGKAHGHKHVGKPPSDVSRAQLQRLPHETWQPNEPKAGLGGQKAEWNSSTLFESRPIPGKENGGVSEEGIRKTSKRRR
jgi:hypothetical protein